MCDGSPRASQSSSPDDFPIGSRLFLENSWYDITSFLGKGGFAKVYRAKHAEDNCDYAIKIVRRRRRDDPKDQKIRREVDIQRGCTNPHIVRVLFATNDFDHYFIVTELCGETLLEYINLIHASSKYVSESTCRNFTRDILNANIYLSNQGIIHRDIKPGNIFLTLKTTKGAEERVKLGDFGLAVYKQDLNPQSVSGTPNYLSPEVLSRLGHSEKSEVWSLACVMFCTLFGKPPFETESVQLTYDRISKNLWSFPYTHVYSLQVRDLIQACLDADPHRRFTFRQMLNHEWFEPHGLRNRGRTKSMLNLPNGGDNFTPLYVVRPRSVLAAEYDDEHVQNSVLRRNRHMFITGSSHDSGIGSDENLCRQNRLKMENSLKFFLEVIARYLSGYIRLKAASTSNALFVSKWVDYTNRSGFACVLNDGVFAMKFNPAEGGGCLSWNRVSDHAVYSTSPYSAARSHMRYPHEADTDISKKLMTATEYHLYMEARLSNTGGNNCYHYCSDDLVPFLLHHQIVQGKYLIMVFSNSLIQINFFTERLKFVFIVNSSPDGYYREEQFRLYVICPAGTVSGFKSSIIDDGESARHENIIPNMSQYMLSIHNLLKHDCDVTPKMRTLFAPLVTSC